jgi:hypothetical protein
MPWLPLYADENDFAFIHSWLNSQEEIAFLVSDGEKRWKAVRTIPELQGPRHCLWHVHSGPLPLLAASIGYVIDVPGPRPIRRSLGSSGIDGVVQDPWTGWQELLTGHDPTQPYFGWGHPGVYWLNVRPKASESPEGLGLSSFEWVGNGYKCIGRPAPECAAKWWNTLKRWTKKQAIRIPRVGPWDGEEDREIWAFPSALERIRRGCDRDLNP